MLYDITYEESKNTARTSEYNNKEADSQIEQTSI